MNLLMVFIDGFGLGAPDGAVNPLLAAEMPFIRRILAGRPLTRESVAAGLSLPGVTLRPLDVRLDVPGIPQSATGQTALFTGVNAARIAGRHIHGFPTKSLREILDQHSIFKLLSRAGRKAVFANTFTAEYFEAVQKGRGRARARHSVTTVAAMAGREPLRMLPDLGRGAALYQDITNEMLRERGYAVDIATPEEAARRLAHLAAANDFTLFEYFQTDRCGHKQDWELALQLLSRLDRFLGALAGYLADNRLTLLVVSDHGNIEDLSVKTHTFNPVPVIAIGEGAAYFSGAASLVDIYPALLRFFDLEGRIDLKGDFQLDLSKG